MEFVKNMFSQEVDFLLVDDRADNTQKNLEKDQDLDVTMVVLSASRSTNKAGLMTEAFDQFDFPDALLNDWDKLYNSLLEVFENVETKEFLLVIPRADKMLIEEPDEEVGIFLEILADTADGARTAPNDINFKIAMLIADPKNTRMGDMLEENEIPFEFVEAD
ncbi:MAG TPA: hypothetical protein DCS15_06390 [Flavobacteriales bacterium]|nr:barstar family protein [Salibacteraceae bacterium]HAS36097.1 hypothetical protein [Flavobacteriales bacterium]